MTTPSPRRPTMADVAARAGVSRALVSIVFREQPGAGEETRARVRAAAEELGYRPDHRARLLSRRQTRLLGVTFTVGAEFHADLLAELYVAAAGLGYELVLSGVTPTRSESLAVHELLALRCDALLLLGPMLADDELVRLAAQLPVVVVARAGPAEAVESVRTDDVAGARLATEHLVGLGHRRIVHVDGGQAPGAAERRTGYQEAMDAAGLAAEVRLVNGGLTDQDGSRAAEEVLAGADRPSAAFVFNDASAAGFVDVVRRAGRRVPEDISVVAYDNSRLASASWARLTTVSQDVPTLTRVAVELAVARLEGAAPAAPVLVPPALVTRSTTRAHAAAG